MLLEDNTTLELYSIEGQMNKLELKHKRNKSARARRIRDRHENKQSLATNSTQATVKSDPATDKFEKSKGPQRLNDIEPMDTSSYTTRASNDLSQESLDSRDASGTHLYQQESYSEALQRLADSMKRTEQSRRQLMILQRASIDARTPPPQRMLQQGVAPARTSSICTEPPSEHSTNHQSPNTAAFLSGSRSTLTDGLEHSRRQVKKYMGQMGKKTL